MYGMNQNLNYLYMRLRQEAHRGKKKRRESAFQEPKNHLLLDYQEFMTDSASYFLEKEHWSLDGG